MTRLSKLQKNLRFHLSNREWNLAILLLIAVTTAWVPIEGHFASFSEVNHKLEDEASTRHILGFPKYYQNHLGDWTLIWDTFLAPKETWIHVIASSHVLQIVDFSLNPCISAECICNASISHTLIRDPGLYACIPLILNHDWLTFVVTFT